MAQQPDADDTQRHETEDVDATDLSEGDRIDQWLVSRTMSGLGSTHSSRPDAPSTQFAEATVTHGRDDFHRAILVDGETGMLVRASCHDSESAWTQTEADWTVREVGTRVSVEDAEVARDPEDEWVDVDAVQEAESWANVALQERAMGFNDFDNDDLTLERGDSLTLYSQHSGARVHATISLEADE
jgi:hypothetical protein